MAGDSYLRQAFEDVRIADFGWVMVLPGTVKCLADHGAKVIRIESSLRPDVLRTHGPYRDGKPGPDRATHFAIMNDNKCGMTLNLKHARAMEVIKPIVAWADVVAEGFTPGTMDSLGIGYKSLRKIKPNIIMLSTCNLGQTGPYAPHPGFGVMLAAYSGFSHITGWPDREPSIPYGAYTDVVAPPLGAVALIAALDYRRRTGKGQHIDLAQYEVGVNYLAPAILDYTVNGRVAERVGNRCEYAAPHGAYPCRGSDRWCAIGVFTNEEWSALCKAMGNPPWCQDPRLTTPEGRKAHEPELDAHVAEWTRQLEAEEVMSFLQSAGVAAGVVKTCQDLYADPQLRHRGHFQPLEHAEIGWHFYETPAFKLSETPAKLTAAAPTLGQHNEYVCTQLLGMPDGEFAALAADGVFE